MAAYTATQTNEVIGTLTNGVKLVMTTYGISGVGTDAANASIPPLRRVLAMVPCEEDSTVAGIGAWTQHATLLHTLTFTPAASNDGNNWKILTFGF